jgi:RIO-like serine/threonine protein kinase
VSGRIVGEVLDHAPDLPETEWRVLIALAEDANDRDRIARYSSAERLSERARRAEGSVRNALAKLTAKGLIQPLLKAHRGKVQHYQIARLAAAHRFVTYADQGSTHRPDKRRKASPPEVTHSSP